MGQNAIHPTRAENYPEWYAEVIRVSDLAENAPVRGCMVIKPWGFALWENIQKTLDQKFKDTGHQNAYFPLLIPLSFLEKEAAHVEGFAKECAVVTHHRLKVGPAGKLIPDGLLEEPLVIRPTSETIIGHTFAKWVQSYRDLPILINQWCNVMRWEMRTRMFLRTSEFLWQEGHTVHATRAEAEAETAQMLDIYEDFARNYLAMPVIKSLKTPDERFPGAVDTYSIEAMMQDGKALQAGTSHFLGQNFARASEIKFLDQSGQETYAWTTSWGVSTRLIGGLIMTHSDDNGLVLPPKIAPLQITLLPIFKNDQEKSIVLPFVEALKQELRAQRWDDQPLRVDADLREMRGGEKSWQAIKRGIPLRVEIGPREVAQNKVYFGLRDAVTPQDKQSLPREEFLQKAPDLLRDLQQRLLEKALQFRQARTRKLDSLQAFQDFFQEKPASADSNRSDGSGGFALVHWNEAAMHHESLAPLKVTPRGIPISAEPQEAGTCIFTGKPSQGRVLFAKSY